MMNQTPDSPAPVSAARNFQAVFRAAPDGILLVDAQGAIADANPEALRLFGYDARELVGQGVEILVPEAVREGHGRHRTQYLEDPRTRPMGIGMELEGVRKDGRPFPVEISLSPLRSPGADRVIAIVRDLTERRRLKGFGVGALRAAEEERRRIARELHDETAQSLAALLMRLKVLERTLEVTSAAEEVQRLRGAVHAAMEGVCQMARGLRPPELEDVGLAAALRSYVRERFSSSEVVIDLDGSERRLSMEQSLVAYRIAQEALSNAVRHGRARRVTLRVRRSGKRGSRAVCLEVSDDGCGFDRDRLAEPGAGLGLVGMEERAELAGGHMRLFSRPGGGTQLRVVLPVEGEDPEDGDG